MLWSSNLATRIAGTFVAAALTLGGCGGDDSGGGDGGTMSSAGTMDSGLPTGGTGVGEDPTQTVRALVQARCTWLFNCCDRGELNFSLGPFTANADDCTARVLGVLESGNATPPVDAGPADLLLLLVYAAAQNRITFNPDAVTGCIEFLQASQCNPAPDPMGPQNCVPDQSDLGDPCDVRALVTGRQEVGEECEPRLQAECAAGSRCVDFGSSGVCAAQAADAEPCFADEDCVDPLICNFAGNGTCAAGAGIGAPCEFADPMNPVPGTESVRCARDLTCDTQSLVCVGGDCAPGKACQIDQECPVGHFCNFEVCLPPQDGGAMCEQNEHCLSNSCNQFTFVCTGTPGGELGSTCFSDFACQSGYCELTTNTCENPVPNGQACPSNRTTQCADGRCDTTDIMNPVCVAYSGDGGTCLTVAECDPALELQCFMGVCQKLPNGQTCFADNLCASGLCFNSVCADPTPVGSACNTGAVNPPCIAGSFCDIPAGMMDGSCAMLLGTGQPCTLDEQCWGACVEKWNARLCDSVPATGTATCDGP